MDAESFNELALRVIAGEATADDRQVLDAELARDESCRSAFTEMKIEQTILRETAPMLDAVKATTPELPAHRVNELRTAVRQQFGPVLARGKHTPLLDALRWIIAGGGLAGLAVVIVVLCFADRTIEVGLYATDQVRSGDHALTAQDVPTAELKTFEQDAPFDQWQSQPLAWYERGKIWVDNERDQLHIVHRVGHGEVVSEAQPLAPTDEAQREQIRQAVQSLNR